MRHPLNSEHKFKSLIKFIKWQLGIRLLNRKVVTPWVDDSSFICGLGETGMTGNFYTGLIEYEDMAFLLHALQPEEIFVDIGANVGAYTILASKVIGSQSIAFEPLPETIDRLKDQIQINRINSRVDIRNKGVGDKKCQLFFTNNNDTTNKVSLTGNLSNSSIVELTTLDIELDNSSTYFLKIDVEGYEFNVIEGASNLLLSDAISAVIIELNGNGLEFGFSNEIIHQKIIDFGFKPIRYNPKLRTVTESNSFNKNLGNTIYVKDIERISNLCKISDKRIIHTAWGLQL
jgi:FkbM family methyltransferase